MDNWLWRSDYNLYGYRLCGIFISARSLHRIRKEWHSLLAYLRVLYE